VVREMKPLFEVGQVGATPTVMAEVERHVGISLYALAPGILARHVTGDWGEVDKEDWRTNDAAVKNGTRIVSAYDFPARGSDDLLRVWVITEADRSSTTILLPEDY
jgi:hypothetical protein